LEKSVLQAWQHHVPWYEYGVVELEMQVWWTATGSGCAWDICNTGRSAAQADRALVCGIIIEIDDGPVSTDRKSFAAQHSSHSTCRG
jgi:hypothetical protein